MAFDVSVTGLSSRRAERSLPARSSPRRLRGFRWLLPPPRVVTLSGSSMRHSCSGRAAWPRLVIAIRGGRIRFESPPLRRHAPGQRRPRRVARPPDAGLCILERRTTATRRRDRRRTSAGCSHLHGDAAACCFTLHPTPHDSEFESRSAGRGGCQQLMTEMRFSPLSRSSTFALCTVVSVHGSSASVSGYSIACFRPD